jgi:molecular chaperone GrpE
MNRFSFALRVLVRGVPAVGAPVAEPAVPITPRQHPVPPVLPRPTLAADLDVDPAALDEPWLSPSLPAPEPAAASAPEPAVALPSETAQELIALRDKVLQAADQPTAVSPTALASLAGQLGQILALEQVVAIEEEGEFDAARQRVVDTIDTADPAKDYLVAATVRPGYLHDGQVLRHQDVVLFRQHVHQQNGEPGGSQ